MWAPDVGVQVDEAQASIDGEKGVPLDEAMAQLRLKFRQGWRLPLGLDRTIPDQKRWRWAGRSHLNRSQS